MGYPLAEAWRRGGLHGRHSGPLTKVRITVGGAVDLGRVDLSAYCRVQIPVNRNNAATEHILGASVRANFRHRRPRRGHSAEPVVSQDDVTSD